MLIPDGDNSVDLKSKLIIFFLALKPSIDHWANFIKSASTNYVPLTFMLRYESYLNAVYILVNGDTEIVDEDMS